MKVRLSSDYFKMLITIYLLNDTVVVTLKLVGCKTIYASIGHIRVQKHIV